MNIKLYKSPNAELSINQISVSAPKTKDQASKATRKKTSLQTNNNLTYLKELLNYVYI